MTFEKVALSPLPASAASKRQHTPRLSTRNWLGGQAWVFDDGEPIMLLLTAKDVESAPRLINNVKLRPGYKPLLAWNSFWNIRNQGAYPEGNCTSTAAKVSGGGKTLLARWTGRQVKDRFTTRTDMTIGYDQRRDAYTYDIASELEVLPGTPFRFAYGYDFEHHTPLDPFNWQYLVVRMKGNVLNHRPVCTYKHCSLVGLQQSRGLRVWYGHHREKMPVSPAVEYDIDPATNKGVDGKPRQLSTDACEAFFDTPALFEAETAPAGTKIRVKYCYTGYPAAEAEALFKASRVYPNPRLDPNHHFIFAEEWPRITFSKFVPMSESWAAGRQHFGSGHHNAYPAYELVQKTGFGSGFAMKLGPAGYATATLPVPSPFPKGRYVLNAQCRSINTHGPGGEILLAITEGKSARVLKQITHFVGNGSFDWKRVGFVFDAPGGDMGLTLGFRNAGTGEVFFAEVTFERLAAGAKPASGVMATPNAISPALAVPVGVLADYRMEEGSGMHVYDHARGPFGMLELVNADWVKDGDRDPGCDFRTTPKVERITRVSATSRVCSTCRIQRQRTGRRRQSHSRGAFIKATNCRRCRSRLSSNLRRGWASPPTAIHPWATYLAWVCAESSSASTASARLTVSASTSTREIGS